jgi:hypothetical protein
MATFTAISVPANEPAWTAEYGRVTIGIVRFVEILMVCSLVLLSASLVSAAPIPEPKPFSHPSTVGTKWVYQNGDREQTVVVSAVEKKGAETIITLEEVLKDGKTTPYEIIAISEKGIFRLDVIGLKPKGPMCLFRFPPKAGDNWQVEISVAALGPMTVSTIGLEDVTVPAGTYKAWRVEAKFATVGKQVGTCWFVPGLGLVKSTWDTQEQILKSFKPKD